MLSVGPSLTFVCHVRARIVGHRMRVVSMLTGDGLDDVLIGMKLCV